MAAIIDQKLVEHLSWLARLELTGEEKRRFGKQLGKILDYVGKVEGMTKTDRSYRTNRTDRTDKTDRADKTGLINGLVDNLRRDQPRQCLTAQQVLANAPSSHQGYFRVTEDRGRKTEDGEEDRKQKTEDGN